MIRTTNAREVATDAGERRRVPRIEILGLRGKIQASDLPVTVREIGLGGLSIVSAVAFVTGTVHELRLTRENLAPVVVKARVVHCHRHTAPGGQAAHLTGFEFVDPQPHGDRSAIDELIDGITSVLSFGADDVE